MKALVVSNMYPSTPKPSFGVFVERMTTQMAADGIEVQLAVRTGEGNKLISYALFYWRAFWSTIFTSADFVYVHFATHSFPPVWLALLFKRIPLVMNVHGADIAPENKGNTFRNRILARIARGALDRADLVVAPSNYFRQEVNQRFGTSLSKIHVSPSGGVERKVFRPAELPVSAKRRLLFLGRLIDGKGVSHIIPALNLLSERRPELLSEVVFAGDGPARQALEYQASASNHLSVEFLGSVDPERIPSVIGSCHGLIFPSYRRGESLGLVAIEAMSCGRLVLAARSGAMTEIIKHGHNGYLFAPDDARSLSDALETFFDLNAEDLRRLSHNAWIDSTQYDSSAVGAALSSALRKRFNPATEERT